MGEHLRVSTPKGLLKHALAQQAVRTQRDRSKDRPNHGQGRAKGAKNRVTAELVEQELARIAFFDPLELYKTLAGMDGAAPIFTLRALHEMPRDVRACIASIKIRNENLTSGDGVRDQTVEIKFWDKIKALEICAKHLGYIDGKGGNISAKELLEFLEAGRRRNALRGASLVRPELPEAPVVDVEAAPAADPLSVDAVNDVDDDDADLTI
jgi:hypothetical protein